MILGFSAACQTTFVPEAPTPTSAQLPQAVPTLHATQTPRAITRPTRTAVPSPLPTPTPFPGDVLRLSATSAPVASLLPSVTPAVIPAIQVIPTETRVIPTIASATPGTPGTPTATIVMTDIPGANTFSLGTSVEGRDILAWKFGTGEKVLLLVGGIHTGYEANTVELINEMIAHFEGTPADVKAGITIMLVPVLNPDGLMVGRRSEGRFNAHGIDLNRNWGCEWSADAHWKDQLVDPGPRAFSEPETLALASWIRSQRPAAAIFYHSAANGVFAGDCNGDHTSDAFAQVLGEAAGYPYGQPFTAYPVSGTESNWVDGLGIPAVDLELTTTVNTEFDRNIKGVLAVECWLTTGRASC